MEPETSSPIGVVRVRDYEQVIKGDLFRSMEDFSAMWITKNAAALCPYAEKWVSDPCISGAGSGSTHLLLSICQKHQGSAFWMQVRE
jgi:hypothetical protein